MFVSDLLFGPNTHKYSLKATAHLLNNFHDIKDKSIKPYIILTCSNASRVSLSGGLKSAAILNSGNESQSPSGWGGERFLISYLNKVAHFCEFLYAVETF